MKTINTFKEVLEWWKNTPLKNGKDRVTQEARYRTVLKYLGDCLLHELWGKTIFMVNDLKKSGLAPATINKHIAIAKAACRSAYDHRTGKEWKRMIPDNYLSGFPTLPENNITHRILTPEERDKLYNELPEYLKPLFYFSTYYPCRKSEILQVKTEDINLFTKKIWIPEDRSKTGRGRFIPIPLELIPWVISVKNIPEMEYLFSREDYPGRYNPILDFSEAWSGACSRAGIKGYNWHKTRQQAAMELMYEGWDSMQVMHVGGWKSMAAFRRYVDVDEIMIDIRTGHFKPDFSWRTKHAPLPVDRKAA